MPFAAEAITLTTEERMELEQMTQSRTLPAGDVLRARLILMLAENLPYRTIQERLDTAAPTISRWKNRFLKQRVAGLLEIRHPGQKPSVITPALQAKVLEATRHQPKDGSTDWSCRKLAGQLGIGAQDLEGRRLSLTTSQRDAPLHSDLFLLAQPGGALVLANRARCHCPWRFQFCE